MTIVLFPTKPYVMITSRLVAETCTTISNGTTRVKYDPPVATFYIDYKDEDGLSCCVWDGCSYDGALAAAREWAQDGVAIRDRVTGGGGAE